MPALSSQPFHLTELLQHKAQSGRTGAFKIQNEDGQLAMVGLTAGIITHAEAASQQGKEALFTALRWKTLVHQWMEGPHGHPVTMTEQVENLLIEFCSYVEEKSPTDEKTNEKTRPIPPISSSASSTGSGAMYRFTLIIPDPKGPKEYTFSQKQLFVGRTWGNDIIIRDISLSRKHAFLCLAGDAVIVRDLGSTNGTAIDSIPIAQGLLRHGQKLTMGDVICTLRVESVRLASTPSC